MKMVNIACTYRQVAMFRLAWVAVAYGEDGLLVNAPDRPVPHDDPVEAIADVLRRVIPLDYTAIQITVGPKE